MTAPTAPRLRMLRVADPIPVPALPIKRRAATGQEEVPDWRLAAGCLREDLNLFFPVGTLGAAAQLQVAAAKKICAACPVQPQCLSWALDVGPEFGIFGGSTELERRRLRNERSTGPRWRSGSGPHRSETAVHEALEPF